MRDDFLRLLRAAMERAMPKAAEAPPPPEWTHWYGRPVLDPDGKMKIGHVVAVSPDGGAGAWLQVSVDWGVLDWLPSLGAAGHPRFTFHSDDVSPGESGLVLKASAAPPSEAA